MRRRRSGRAGADSPLTPGSAGRPTDCAPALASPQPERAPSAHSPEAHFSARRPRRGRADVARPPRSAAQALDLPNAARGGERAYRLYASRTAGYRDTARVDAAGFECSGRSAEARQGDVDRPPESAAGSHDGAVPALPVRGPLPRGGNAACARALAALTGAASRDSQGDTGQAHRCAGGVAGAADHRDRTRREESLRPRSGCAASASLQGPPAGQHRHVSPGR